jgi:hypothetical protein
MSQGDTCTLRPDMQNTDLQSGQVHHSPGYDLAQTHPQDSELHISACVHDWRPHVIRSQEVEYTMETPPFVKHAFAINADTSVQTIINF